MRRSVFLVIAIGIFRIPTSRPEVHDACEQRRIPQDLGPAIESCCPNQIIFDEHIISICTTESNHLVYQDRMAAVIRCFLEKLNWIYPNGIINPEGIEKNLGRREYLEARDGTTPTGDMKRVAVRQCTSMLMEFSKEHPSATEPEDTAVLLYMCSSLGATVRCLREQQPIAPICVRYRDLLELCVHDVANLAAFTNRSNALNGNT